MVNGLLMSWKQHSTDSLTSVKLQGTSYKDDTGDTQSLLRHHRELTKEREGREVRLTKSAIYIKV